MCWFLLVVVVGVMGVDYDAWFWVYWLVRYLVAWVVFLFLGGCGFNCLLMCLDTGGLLAILDFLGFWK